MVKENISKRERQMYDRQIRVWGLKAQQRLRNASVLIIGTGALSTEISKNLVLSGIGSLNLIENNQQAKVDKDDVKNIFYLSEDNINRSRIDCLVEYLKELNPNVKINAANENLENLNKKTKFSSNYNVICCCECSLTTQIIINKICREHNIAFFSGDIFGDNGICFTDLGNEFKFRQKDKEETINYIPIYETLMPSLSCFSKRMVKEKLFFMLIKSVYLYENKNQQFPLKENEDDIIEILKKECENSKFKFEDNLIREFTSFLIF